MIDDEQFKKLLAAIEKPKKNKLISFVNSGLFLWFLTLCVVSAGGAFITSYQQCVKDAEDEIEKHAKIERELLQRELKISEIIRTASNLAEIKIELKKAKLLLP